MACLKCGNAVADGQVFCANCLEKMAQSPVKPDAVVHIPQRPAVTHEKRPAPRATEQLARLRKLIRWLFAIIAALALLLSLSVGALIYIIRQDTTGSIGTNYTADTRLQP